MWTFASLLNKNCEWFMTLELDCSFSSYLLYFLFVSSLSPNFPSELTSKLEPPSSPILNLLTRVSKRSFMLWMISTTYSYSLENLSSDTSLELLIDSMTMVGVYMLKPIWIPYKFTQNAQTHPLQYQYDS